MKYIVLVCLGVFVLFGSFYLGVYIQANSSNFVDFKIDWNLLLSFFTAIGTVAIPFVLYSLGKKEANRKEERDEEADRRDNLLKIRINQISPLLEKIYISQIKYQKIVGDETILDKRQHIRECFMEFLPIYESLFTGLRSIERSLLPQEKEIFSNSMTIIIIIREILNQYISVAKKGIPPIWTDFQNILISLINITRSCIDDIDESVIYYYSKNIDKNMINHLQIRNDNNIEILQYIEQQLNIDII